MKFNQLVNRYTLAFNDADLEHEFQQYYFQNTIGNLRVGILLMCFAYALFGILDIWIVPEVKLTIWIIRYLIVCPLGLVYYVVSFTSSFRHYWQFSLSILVLVAAFGVVAMVAVANAPGSYLYYAGISMVLFSTFLFLRFVVASSAGWIIIFSYNIVASLYTGAPAPILINNNFFLITASVSIMAVTYMLELSARKNFHAELNLKLAKQKTEQLNEHLKKISTLDGLTGISNRRRFDLFLEKEWRRNMRSSLPISLILFDIDFFKLYNDHYGHQAGDDCLKEVGTCMEKFGHRPGDLVARYGGEEFVIILSGIDSGDAVKMAEKVRAAVEAMGIEHQKSSVAKCVTISVGVATLTPQLKAEPAELIAKADEALYAAKAAGRNQVKIANGPNKS